MSVKKVRDINRVPELLKNLKEYLKYEVHVGYFKEDDKQTLLIATVHEYGTNIKVTPKMRAWFAYQGFPLKASTTEIKIPERSFMRTAWENGLTTKLNKFTEDAVQEMILNKRSARSVLEELGELSVKEVQDYMRSLKRPPLSPMSDHSNPLVDTGKLLNSITYKIERR